MRRRATFPTTQDAKHWKKVGTEHGRREFPREADAPHPLEADLSAAVTIEILEIRRRAMLRIDEITGQIKGLEGENDSLDPTVAMPSPRRRAVVRQKEQLATQVELLVAQRAAVNDEAMHQIRCRIEIGHRADAAYREANGLARRIPLAIAEANLSIDPDLLTPLI